MTAANGVSLTQEEIDALIAGDVPANERDVDEVRHHDYARPYDLATEQRIMRNRMVTLENINERFGRLLRGSLFNLIRRGADVSVGPLRTIRHSDFVRQLPVPANLNLVRMKPLRGTALFVFDTNFIFAAVDTLFGGDGRFKQRVDGRDFTNTEQRVIQRLRDLTLADYVRAWEPVFALETEYLRAEMYTKFAAIATPNEMLLVTTIRIEFGGSGGDLTVCLPYSMIEPVRDVLSSSISRENREIDRRWTRQLLSQVRGAPVELVTELAELHSTVDGVMRMRVGDVLPIAAPGHVVAKIDGVTLIDGEQGISNHRYALRVKQLHAAGAARNDTQHDDAATDAAEEPNHD